MIRLALVELRRTFARGTIRILIAIAVVGIVAAGLIAMVANPSREVARTTRLSQYESQMKYCLSGYGSADGLSTPGGGPAVPTTNSRSYCELQTSYLKDQVDNAGFRLAVLWKPGIPATEQTIRSEGTGRRGSGSDGGPLFSLASLLMIGGLLGGASLIGAEWQAGTFVTLLTWEPRRVRLFLIRTLVAAVVAGLVAWVALALLAAALYPTAAIKGSTAGLGTEWWFSYLGASARVGAVVGVAAIVGSSLAMIGRRTALAIITGFLYFAVVESLLSAWKEGLRPWLMVYNFVLFVTGEDVVATSSRTEMVPRPMWVGGAILLGYSVVLLAIASAMFRRKDFISG